jgi:hypothetical protein
MIIFNNTSAEIKRKSADVLLKMTTTLKALTIAQLGSKNKQTIVDKLVIQFEEMKQLIVSQND